MEEGQAREAEANEVYGVGHACASVLFSSQFEWQEACTGFLMERENEGKNMWNKLTAY